MSKYGGRFELLFIWFLSSGIVFGAQPAAQLSNVTIAYTSISPQYAPVWIAKEAGFFKRNGIDALSLHAWRDPCDPGIGEQ